MEGSLFLSFKLLEIDKVRAESMHSALFLFIVQLFMGDNNPGHRDGGRGLELGHVRGDKRTTMPVPAHRRHEPVYVVN